MVSSGAPWRPVLAIYAHTYIGVILKSPVMNCYWDLILLLNLVSFLTNYSMGLLSVVRPFVVVCGIDFFQILVVASPGPYAQRLLSFMKTFSFFMNIFRFR